MNSCSTPTDELHSLKKVLDSLLYRRIDSAWLLVAFFNTLETWLDENPEVRSRFSSARPSKKAVDAVLCFADLDIA